MGTKLFRADNMSPNRVLLMVLLLSPYFAIAEIPCPPMPGSTTDVNHDVKSRVNAAIGSLGKFKAGDLSVQTDVVAKNLVKDFPNADRLFIAQMFAATYCVMIRDNSHIGEKDKPLLWEKFQDRTYAFILGHDHQSAIEQKRRSRPTTNTATGSPRETPSPSSPPGLSPGPVASSATTGQAAGDNDSSHGRHADISSARAAAVARNSAVTGARPTSSTSGGPISWEQDFFLTVAGTGRTAKIYGWLIRGKSTALVRLKDAYIVSELTGHKEPLSVYTEGLEQIRIDQIEPVPSNAPIQLGVEWQSPLSVQEFLEKWGHMEFDVIYDHDQFSNDFSDDYVRQRVYTIIPGSGGPQITRKN
jgi:hypothetical protein